MRLIAIIVAALLAVMAGAIPAADAQNRGALSVPIVADDGRPSGSTELYARSYALVIGNDAYRDPAWPRLSFAVKDAREVAGALERHGFVVTVKTDLGAEALRKAIEDFIYGQPGIDADARVLIWFAGHGETVNDEAFLVPIDAPASATRAQFRRTALPLSRVGDYMRHADARHVLVVFDSCFSGNVFHVARDAPPPKITKDTKLVVRQMISSGEASQKVSDDGTFRRLFVDALDGREPTADANRDGYITGTELGLFLSQKISNLTLNAQTPRYGKLRDRGYDLGDFVFKVAQQVASAQPAQPLGAPGSASSTGPKGGRAPGTGATPANPPFVPGEAQQAWQQAEKSNDVEVVEAFIIHFRDTYYAVLARRLLAKLRAEKVLDSSLLLSSATDTAGRREADPPTREPGAGSGMLDDVPEMPGQLVIMRRPTKDRKGVSQLSFIDAETRAALSNTRVQQIAEIVREGIGSFTSQRRDRSLGTIRHKPDNGESLDERLSRIYWDLYLTRTEKIDRIVDDLMQPSDIDLLVAGQYHELRDGTIRLRPFVIDRATKWIVTASRDFTREDFECPDPAAPPGAGSILCKRTREVIIDLVRRLLEQS